ncbi:cell division protein FtsL [Terasakiella sp. SH-1]|uniref:cell division protein FtsL n=1 Tax=Terasakiella sp. SH-1 TaxID=2560057 RepID=UPI00142F95B8|nr:cell division protein FtsL [Terasakiella sp. SH-1]
MTRLTIGLTVFLAIVLAIGVFRITYQVDALEKELKALNKEILQEQETIHILKAEWSYLNDPNRLEDLAKRYLGLEEMRGEQLINMDMFDKQLLPTNPNVQPTKAGQ